MKRKPAQRPPDAEATPDNGQQSQLISASWAGPLPPPSTLESFDHVVPGSAERIIAMAEREQAHRITFDQTEQRAAIREYAIGQILGWVTVMSCIGGAGYTAYIGAHATVSIAFLGVPVAAVIKQFLSRRRIR